MIIDNVSYQECNYENIVNHYCYHVHDTSKNLKYDHKIHFSDFSFQMHKSKK
jgi:hypothetical protein